MINVTSLSVLVEAELALPKLSEATPAAIEAVTVPSVVMPLTATVKVVPSVDAISVTVPVVAPAVPVRMTSPAGVWRSRLWPRAGRVM